MNKLLLVDDDNISREMLAAYIDGLLGYRVDEACSGQIAYEKFLKNNYSVVITDIKMPVMNGLDLLKKIKSSPKGKKTKVILLTGFAQVETAIEAIRQGAFDYLVKPIDINRLGEIIKNISIEEALGSSPFGNSPLKDDEINNNGEQFPDFPYIDIVGFEHKIGIFSQTMKNIVTMSYKLHKDPDVPVLIEGDSGTGKEIIASLVHHGTKGSKLPYVTINCAAISTNLFETEFFGYEAGTFTGGSTDGKIGKLELANGGTILLDEIGEIPLEMQAKLLRVIQEKSFFRVGGTKETKINIRIIACTNKSLAQLVRKNKFRYDLFYRINSATITIPPLCEQKEAIAPLAQMFLVEFATKKKKKFRLIEKNAISILESHAWKGNIRELKNAIERIVLLYDEYELRANHLSFLEYDIDSMIDNKPVLRLGSFVLPEEGLNLEDFENEIVEKALEKFAGNKTHTAKYLGLTLSSLRSRIK